MNAERLQNLAMVLEQRLALVYREHVLKDKHTAGAARMLKDAIEADQELREVAEFRRKQLAKIPSGKCFISKQHRDYLDAALA